MFYCKTWSCRPGQYQCQTGQCIPKEWLCDLEWDCSDASDEQGLFILKHLSPHNIATLNMSLETLQSHCYDKYLRIQPFFNFCDFSREFPCLTHMNGSGDPLNFETNRPCIPIEKIGDRHIDCYGGHDERNMFADCRRRMLGFSFYCIYTNTCLNAKDICVRPCSGPYYTDAPICMKKHMFADCLKPKDARCLNGTCVSNGRCNMIRDCPEGEDEFWCEYNLHSGKDQQQYRSHKQETYSRTIKDLRSLPVFPTSTISSTVQAVLVKIRRSLTEDEITKLFYCNLGLQMLIYFRENIHSVVCLCPPSFFGYRCEFNSDRITIITHLDLTNSNYTSMIDNELMLKIRAVLFFDNKHVLDTYEFHVRPALEQMEVNPIKHRFYLLYSRTNELLSHKITRYLNRSDLIRQQFYSVQFELFQLIPDKDVQVLALWHFPIYLDFLPAFRLAKVLNISTINLINSSCSCNTYATCVPVMNTNMSRCICKSGRYGPTCEFVDPQCAYFCDPYAFCQPNNPPHNRPTCICAHDGFGPRCFLRYRDCKSNPCQNNGSCFHTYDPRGIQPYICKCSSRFYGPTCAFEKSSVRVHLNVTHEMSHPIASTLLLYDTDVVTLELKLRYHQVERGLPLDWYYLHDLHVAPMFGVLKVYDDVSFGYYLYLIYVQPNVTHINTTVDMSLNNLCYSAYTLLNTSELIPNNI
jgi:hypothetical protein